MRNREFVFTPNMEYDFVAERSEANLSNLQFPTWCPRWDSNPQSARERDFESRAYTNSATWA